MAKKKWNDNEDHSYDEVIVYLTVTDSDGTVRRIREEVLSAGNNWSYTWTNLPKYEKDGTTLVEYDVEEGYVPGYYSTVEKKETITVETVNWTKSTTLNAGNTYLLEGPDGYLSTEGANKNTFKWVDKETAMSSSLAMWSMTGSNDKFRFQNGAGQYITYNNSNNNRFFEASIGNTTNSNQELKRESAGNGFRIGKTDGRRSYYVDDLKTDKTASATLTSGNAITFIPYVKSVISEEQKVDGYVFEVTNTPLDEETSLKVTKEWDLGVLESVGSVNSSIYEKEQVTVKLFANGKETGRSVTLNLKNGWTDTFKGLPYKDTDGNVITYTVEESWDTEDWLATYGDVITVVGNPPTYETTVTNVYRWGQGYELPATGRRGPGIWILCGLGTMIGSLVYGCIWRRKRERGYNINL